MRVHHRHLALETGNVVNHRYRVERKLGEGGMGRVYLVTDQLQQGRQIALKTLRAELSEPVYDDFFSREFEALTKLQHPNLAEVYDFGRIERSGELFFTLEFIIGNNLFVATEQASLEQLLDYLVQTCPGLHPQSWVDSPRYQAREHPRHRTRCRVRANQAAGFRTRTR
jgi:serine/threonine protein kinase